MPPSQQPPPTDFELQFRPTLEQKAKMSANPALNAFAGKLEWVTGMPLMAKNDAVIQALVYGEGGLLGINLLTSADQEAAAPMLEWLATRLRPLSAPEIQKIVLEVVNTFAANNLTVVEAVQQSIEIQQALKRAESPEAEAEILALIQARQQIDMLMTEWIKVTGSEEVLGKTLLAEGKGFGPELFLALRQTGEYAVAIDVATDLLCSVFGRMSDYGESLLDGAEQAKEERRASIWEGNYKNEYVRKAQAILGSIFTGKMARIGPWGDEKWGEEIGVEAKKRLWGWYENRRINSGDQKIGAPSRLSANDQTQEVGLKKEEVLDMVAKFAEKMHFASFRADFQQKLADLPGGQVVSLLEVFGKNPFCEAANGMEKEWFTTVMAYLCGNTDAVRAAMAITRFTGEAAYQNLLLEGDAVDGKDWVKLGLLRERLMSKSGIRPASAKFRYQMAGLPRRIMASWQRRAEFSEGLVEQGKKFTVREAVVAGYRLTQLPWESLPPESSASNSATIQEYLTLRRALAIYQFVTRERVDVRDPKLDLKGEVISLNEAINTVCAGDEAKNRALRKALARLVVMDNLPRDKDCEKDLARFERMAFSLGYNKNQKGLDFIPFFVENPGELERVKGRTFQNSVCEPIVNGGFLTKDEFDEVLSELNIKPCPAPIVSGKL